MSDKKRKNPGREAQGERDEMRASSVTRSGITGAHVVYKDSPSDVFRCLCMVLNDRVKLVFLLRELKIIDFMGRESGMTKKEMCTAIESAFFHCRTGYYQKFLEEIIHRAEPR